VALGRSSTLEAIGLGVSVAVSGDLVAAGAVALRRADAGAVHVFALRDENLVSTGVLSAPGSASMAFGRALALRGTTLAAGAPEQHHRGASTDLDKPPSEAAGPGAVYLFERDSSESWTLRHHIEAPSPGAGDHFGGAVALGQASVLVGAPDEDSATTHVNGDPRDEPNAREAYNGGAAYLFQ
jgi:hypothetical protein